jgi:NADH-quinone oxidoreductase subunit J
MVLAHRERLTPKPTQREWSKRVKEGKFVAGLPAPGVYARHNAVDTPALLPDGTPISELSVSRVLAARDQVVVPDPVRRAQERTDAIEEGSVAMSLINYIYLASVLFAIGGATVLCVATRSSSSWASS